MVTSLSVELLSITVFQVRSIIPPLILSTIFPHPFAEADTWNFVQLFGAISVIESITTPGAVDHEV